MEHPAAIKVSKCGIRYRDIKCWSKTHLGWSHLIHSTFRLFYQSITGRVHNSISFGSSLMLTTWPSTYFRYHRSCSWSLRTAFDCLSTCLQLESRTLIGQASAVFLRGSSTVYPLSIWSTFHQQQFKVGAWSHHGKQWPLLCGETGWFGRQEKEYTGWGFV